MEDQLRDITNRECEEVSSSFAAARHMIPGLSDDVAGAMGYASDECPNLVPLCVDIARLVRRRTGAEHVKVVLQVLVEDGLVVPIRIAEVTVESGLRRPEAIENLMAAVLVFGEYMDKRTSLRLNGKAVTDGAEGPVLPEAARCVDYSTVVLGPAAKSTGDSTPRRHLLRLAAGSVVWSGLANRCLVWVHVGQVRIDTFGTALLPEDEILELLCAKFDSIQDVKDEDLVEALVQDADVKLGELDAVDLVEPRISRYTRYAKKRTARLDRAYPIDLTDYSNCDPQPVIAALRDGWRFLFGAQFVGSVHMHPISPTRRQVPDHIPKPEWACDGKVDEGLQELSRKAVQVPTPEEVANMRQACSIARAALEAAAAMVRPGVNTDAIDQVVHNTVIGRGAYPSWLRFGAEGHTKSCCTSVNEVLCAGVPDSRPLKEGDIVTVYVSAFVHGVHGAVTDTFCVGKVDDVSKRLIQCSRECLEKIVVEVRPGERYRGSGGAAYPQLGAIMTDHAASFGFRPSKVPLYAGIGARLGSAPRLPQYCPRAKRQVQLRTAEWLQPGHTFFLEPLIIAGECQSVVRWPLGALVSKGASTGKTVMVTATGLEVL